MKEDIKILEEFIDYYGFIKDAIGDDNIKEFEINISKNEIKAIENLIQRNKDLEKLAEGIEKIRDFTIPAKTDFIIVMRENYLPHLREDVVLKSKIEEKIENYTIKSKHPLVNSQLRREYTFGIKALQELLD